MYIIHLQEKKKAKKQKEIQGIILKEGKELRQIFQCLVDFKNFKYVLTWKLKKNAR
jgi:hypothetical protein